jgi:hypothetical protein
VEAVNCETVVEWKNQRAETRYKALVTDGLMVRYPPKRYKNRPCVHELLGHLLSGRGGSGLGAPASRAALQDVAVMQQAIEHGTDSGNVTE